MRRKSFYVANPDPDVRPRGNSYVYKPPPLPSSRLSTQPPPPRLSTSSPSQSVQPLRISRNSSVTTFSSASTSNLEYTSTAMANTSNGGHFDSDSDSDVGTSLWKKPPSDIDLPKRSASRSSRVSRKTGRRVSRLESKRESAWARPYIEDVYQHIEEFFPDHDIDKPIIESGPVEDSRSPASPTVDNGRYKRKTIRMVAAAAEEVNRTLSDPVRTRRRGTKLWGSRTKEVTTTEKMPDILLA